MLLDLRSKSGQGSDKNHVEQVLPPAVQNAILKLAAEKAEQRTGFAVVTTQRRPRRWHICACAGPSTSWVTGCGEALNVATMHVEAWQNFDAGNDELCRRNGCRQSLANSPVG